MGLFDLFKPNVEKMKQEGDISGLTKILDNEWNSKERGDKSLSAKVLRALGEMHDIAALKTIITYFVDRNYYCGINTSDQIEMISKYGSSAINQLIPFLEKGTENKNDVIIFSLFSKIGDKRVIDPTIIYFENKKFDLNDRLLAAKTLTEFKDERTILPFVRVYCTLPHHNRDAVRHDPQDAEFKRLLRGESLPEIPFEDRVKNMYKISQASRQIREIEATVKLEKEIERNLFQFDPQLIKQIAIKKPDYKYGVDLLFEEMYPPIPEDKGYGGYLEYLSHDQNEE